VTIENDNLSALLGTLSQAERKAVSDHLAGNPTPESWALIRQLRRKLKKKVRNRVRRFVWLA
jgi:hypothetical protein